MASNSPFESACRAHATQGGVADTRNSFSYCSVLRLALRAVGAAFTPESTVKGH